MLIRCKLFFILFVFCLVFSSCGLRIKYVEPVEFSAEETEGGTRMVVSMSTATEGAEIFYTTDGSTPTSQSAKYAGPVTFLENTTIKAFASKKGYEDSPVSVATVSIT